MSMAQNPGVLGSFSAEWRCHFWEKKQPFFKFNEQIFKSHIGSVNYFGGQAAIRIPMDKGFRDIHAAPTRREGDWVWNTCMRAILKVWENFLCVPLGRFWVSTPFQTGSPLVEISLSRTVWISASPPPYEPTQHGSLKVLFSTFFLS